MAEITDKQIIQILNLTSEEYGLKGERTDCGLIYGTTKELIVQVREILEAPEDNEAT